MKALSCVKFFMCLMKLNRCLYTLKKILAVMLAVAALGAAVCFLTDNKKCVEKCISKIKAVM